MANLPIEGEQLLNIMQNNVSDFSEMICWHEQRVMNGLNHKYCDIPIFKYIEPVVFLEKLSSMNSEDKEHVFSSLFQRYRNNSNSLSEELECLKEIKKLLQEEACNKQGKVSGYNATRYITSYVDKAIKALKHRKLIVPSPPAQD